LFYDPFDQIELPIFQAKKGGIFGEFCVFPRWRGLGLTNSIPEVAQILDFLTSNEEYSKKKLNFNPKPKPLFDFFRTFLID